jgi:hypothetical protein
MDALPRAWLGALHADTRAACAAQARALVGQALAPERRADAA